MKSQKQLYDQLGISQDTLLNYKKLKELNGNNFVEAPNKTQDDLAKQIGIDQRQFCYVLSKGEKMLGYICKK